MESFASFLKEAKATYCGRCGTTHVAPKDGGTCPALKKEEIELDEAEAKDYHSVHVNGRHWKTFNTKSHAENVAKKIKGATVHKYDAERLQRNYAAKSAARNAARGKQWDENTTPESQNIMTESNDNMAAYVAAVQRDVDRIKPHDQRPAEVAQAPANNMNHYVGAIDKYVGSHLYNKQGN